MMYVKVWLNIEMVDNEGNQTGFFKDLKVDVAWTAEELHRVLKTYKKASRMWDATVTEAAIVEEFGRFQGFDRKHQDIPSGIHGNLIREGKRAMKRPAISELKELIKKAHERAVISEKAHEGNSNPQTRELYLIAKARAEAYQEVLDALNGDPSLLRISGKY